jgi:hypothetical protein
MACQNKVTKFLKESIVNGNKKEMIKTERLVLLPLTYEQLKKYIKCDNSLEEELNANKSLRTISPALKEAFEQTILPAVADKTKNYCIQHSGQPFQKPKIKWLAIYVSLESPMQQER